MTADLGAFFDRIEAPGRSLVVVNRSGPRPIQAMLEDVFAGQPVDVRERDLPDSEGDLVVLVEQAGEDAEVVASSPLSALEESILLVNSDLYRTGTTGLDDLEFPEVLRRLDEVPFTLRGYPESHKEKLLLIVVSRYIERRAWLTGEGPHRASFQRLSRMKDERGTRAVYETLADSGVQTHVYGIPDWLPPMEAGLTVHGGYSAPFRDSWFVVFTPPEDGERSQAALVAIETEPRRWRAFWTFRRSLVADIDDYIPHDL